MPTPFIKKISRVYKKPVKKIESLWNSAKTIVLKKYGIDENSLHGRDYAEITSIFKKMVVNKFGKPPKDSGLKM